jgi:RHS repeat-associated protein
MAGTREKSNDSAKDSFSVSAPTLSMPKGGGAIRGIGEKFAANPVTGTGSMSVPIATSPGRSGFGPQLSLAYDSGAGNGAFGFGWSLLLPSIRRKTDKGLPRYADARESDVFVLLGADDLVPAYKKSADGTLARDRQGNPIDDEELRDGFVVKRYQPRIEGLFSKIERWTRLSDGDTFWRSIARDNTTTFYGKTSDSRVADPADGSRVFEWLISESYDDKGNAMVYSYVKEDSEGVDRFSAHERNRNNLTRAAGRYLKRIRYGNRVSRLVEPDLGKATWLFEVVFDYDEGHSEALPSEQGGPTFVRVGGAPTKSWSARPDAFSSYRSGFEVRTYRRCRRVLMFHRFEELAPEPALLREDDGQLVAIEPSLVRSTDFDYVDLDYAQAPSVESELAHRGSTRFASFIRSVTQRAYRQDFTQQIVVQSGVKFVTYLSKALPPVEFDYSQAVIDEQVRDVDPASLENLPIGLDGGAYQWVDLDGEGLSGILTEQAGAWFYKRNLSVLPRRTAAEAEVATARFAPMELLRAMPAPANLAGGQQLLDLAGNGQLDVVQFGGSVPGYFERSLDASFSPFRSFGALPNIDWNDPNLRFVDLTGDGHADVLIADDQIFTWFPSLAERGFGPAEIAAQPFDEELGPRLVSADSTQAIFLSDMSGDGLSDLLRIRNGEVCYWPNLGYGRFGSKVTLDQSPCFDRPELFDTKRLRVADLDGSGTTDILYLGPEGPDLYFNRAGNSLSVARRLSQFPRIDKLATVTTVDLLGNGTACLVWSSPQSGDGSRAMRYVDLMSGQKPHLLVSTKNNLGAETRVSYAPSTKFYLADQAAGTPWLSRVPFPVHVVERVESSDLISRNRFVTRYSYHHGYFDGEDREFRGFGRVDQFDTEELAALTSSGAFPFPAAANVEVASHVPPVLTKTWFHTGMYQGRGSVSKQFEREYYREGDPSAGFEGLAAPELEAMLLEDSPLPGDLSAEEERQACRALKGSILRQEIYALDGSEAADRPYSASERNYTVKRLQPCAEHEHAVFFSHPREAVELSYERKLYEVAGKKRADPRVTHALTLAVDDFGNVLQSLAIGYGRRHDDPDPLLSPADREQQRRTHLTFTESRYTNALVGGDVYRAPAACESRSFELLGFKAASNDAALTNLFRLDDLVTSLQGLASGEADLPYEQWETDEAKLETPARRLIEWVRQLYTRDDLSGPLALESLESLGLPYESYKLALTPGLLASIFVRGKEDLLPNAESVLVDEGGYLGGDELKALGRFPAADPPGYFWVSSGQAFFSPVPRVQPPLRPLLPLAQDPVFARRHFFLPQGARDPFGSITRVGYDGHDLLLTTSEDPLQNSVVAEVDYRVLQPFRTTDPNGNRTEIAFDVLGLVVGTAVMGKQTERRGDSLLGFKADLTQSELDAWFSAPRGPLAGTLLAGATTRVLYDVDRIQRLGDVGKPTYAATLTRETHVADLAPGQSTRVQVSLGYSDGFGREIQKKIQAEPGPVVEGGPPVTPRWISTGWTVFNNKGKPVKQYEPFFGATHEFRFDHRVGVSPTLFYDPIERVVATLHPNHSYEKVVFDPWRQESWDVNDTVSEADPKQDPDVGDFFRRLPDSDYLPSWHAARKNGQRGADEQSAAQRTTGHANTPSRVYPDALGRTCLTLAHNGRDADGNEQRFATRVVLDIEGNPRRVIDAKGRIVMTYDYDLSSTRLHQLSMEAGARWMLDNARKKVIRGWDSRGHALRTLYDPLLRPTQIFLKDGGADEILTERTIYGESLEEPETLNLRGRVAQHFDGSGVASSVRYDFKGNLLEGTRQLVRDYKTVPNWNNVPPLEAEVFSSGTIFDALNRPTAVTTPNNGTTVLPSIVRPTYGEANLLERVDIQLRGAAHATPFVTNLDYDAKGQRTRIAFSSGVTTEYQYDPETFRLTRLTTTRASFSPGERVVQALSYSYDPAGNITHIQDDADLQNVVFFRNQRVLPSNDYLYDATYRLIQASGREHIGQVAEPETSWNDEFRSNLPHPHDGLAMRRYTQEYQYDEVGNIVSVTHHSGELPTVDTQNFGPVLWRRRYVYGEASAIQAASTSNRLSRTTVGNAKLVRETYSYDSHGNMRSMPQLKLMEWDYKDQLQATQRQVVNDGVGEKTYYVYDSLGERTRKVTERQNGTTKNERIYLGGFELYREYDADGKALELERETLHVMDDKQRIALVETKTVAEGARVAAPSSLTRYQHGNHLGSAALELDQVGKVISYEEYHPYGSTAYQGVRSTTEVSAKRFRYTGKERDEETGLGYHGARYHAAWLGRWASTDPRGLVDGVNLYAYCHNNPVTLTDPTGTVTQPLKKNLQERVLRGLRKDAHLGFDEAPRTPGQSGQSAEVITPEAHELLQTAPKLADQPSQTPLLREQPTPPVPVPSLSEVPTPDTQAQSEQPEKAPRRSPAPPAATDDSKAYPRGPDIQIDWNREPANRLTNPDTSVKVRPGDESDITDSPYLSPTLDKAQAFVWDQLEKNLSTPGAVGLGAIFFGVVLLGLQSGPESTPGPNSSVPFIDPRASALKPKVLVVPKLSVPRFLNPLIGPSVRFRLRVDPKANAPRDPNALPGIGFPGTPSETWSFTFSGTF